jgi:glycosyltransferase involved in cell wall biosynthesis
LDLVEAFSILTKRLADSRLIIVGDFAATERDIAAKRVLAALIRDRQVETRVTLTGYVPDIREYLAIADVFVLPSLREGMPQSVLEAMAMGKPVVATNIRGCREEVVDGVTGHLVPVRQPEALAEALGRILSSPETARQMGEAGRRRVVELFDERRVVQLELAIYRELLYKADASQGL